MLVIIGIKKFFLLIFFILFSCALLPGKSNWKLNKGTLAFYYKNLNKFKEQKLSLVLRLEKLYKRRGQIYFYDEKGSSLILSAPIIYYNNKLLTNFRNLPRSVYFQVSFIGKGTDAAGNLTGKLLYIKRTVLSGL